MNETITSIHQIHYTGPDSVGVLIRLIDDLKAEIRDNFFHSGDSLWFCTDTLTEAQRYLEFDPADRFRGIKFRAENLIRSFIRMIESGVITEKPPA